MRQPTIAPEHLAERHLARRRLNACLAKIPDDQRDVFLLHEEAGLSIDEIANVTGVNRETSEEPASIRRRQIESMRWQNGMTMNEKLTIPAGKRIA